MDKQSEQEVTQNEIAYVVATYPTLTTTFLVRELIELERCGQRIHIYSWRKPLTAQRHPEHGQVQANVTYLPQWDKEGWFRIVTDHLWCLMQSPIRYVKAVFAVQRSRDRRHKSAFRMAPSLVRTLSASSATAHLHAHSAGWEASMALIVHRLTGITFSFTAHCSDLWSSPRVLIDKVRDAAFVVVVSDFNREAIIERHGSDMASNVHVVRYGLNRGPFETIRQARQASSKKRTSRPFSILTIARLVPKKGHSYLIEALALLKQQGREFRWTVVGDGESKDDLTRMVEQRGLSDWVNFTGAVVSTRVMELLEETDVSVLPSVWGPSGEVDGIPLAAIESLAAGVPVVSTNISGIPELIEDQVTGLLLAPEDAQALAGAIQRMMDDADLRERLAEAGWVRVDEEFDTVKNIAKLRALYDTVGIHAR